MDIRQHAARAASAPLEHAQRADPARRFDDALRWLSSFTDFEQLVTQAPARSTFDLGRMERLLDRLAARNAGRPAVHITGTKGKTSATWMTDAILRAHGLSTFRFISPHVERVHERLALNGVEIGDDAFADLADTLRATIEDDRSSHPDDLPSFFEATTAMGFLLARKRDVDAMILEVGLGGRLDATNVVDPTVSVITSIGLDHCRILGPTREAIAFEKAGILKPGKPAVTGLAPKDPAFEVIRARAAELRCPLSWPGQGFQLTAVESGRRDDGGPSLTFSGSTGGFAADGFTLRAGAPHQALNALLALTAASHVLALSGRGLDAACARVALARLDFPARAEWIQGTPPILLDGAHTTESMRDLADVAAGLARGRPLHLLCGLTRDRDPAAIFGPILPRVASVTTTSLPTPRSRSAAEVLALLPVARIPAQAEPDRAAALERARALAGRSGVVVIAGSLYLAGACRGLLRSAGGTRDAGFSARD